jgi:hypothetical protein
MGFNLRSLSPLLTTAVLVWALLQPLRAQDAHKSAATRSPTQISIDRGTAAETEPWTGDVAGPQVSNYLITPGIMLQ